MLAYMCIKDKIHKTKYFAVIVNKVAYTDLNM